MRKGTKGPPGMTSASALTRTLDVIGGKWTVQIVHELMEGSRRFTELSTALDGVSPKMLVARLRELEEQGFVTRTMHPEIPPRVEYALTQSGHSLKPVIDAMVAWGANSPHNLES